MILIHKSTNWAKLKQKNQKNQFPREMNEVIPINTNWAKLKQQKIKNKESDQ